MRGSTTRAWPRPGVYDWIQKHGELTESEMLRVFNCGIGMIVIAPHDQADDIVQRLEGLGERAYVIGVIERKVEGQPPLHIDPGFRSRD